MGAGMTGRALAAVIALTRGWLRVYTARTAPEIAAARRAEIESDLWEMQHDAEVTGALVGMALGRLIDGMADDLAWRFENLALDTQMLLRRTVAVTAATLMVLSLWMVPSLFLNGRREVASCAATAPQPQTDADLRLEVMRCAGAFFSSAR
jgi:hypothetical protein